MARIERADVRRLYRSTDDRVIAGVCGGLAEHLGIDLRLVRCVFVALALTGGAGLVLYGAFWAVVPQRPGGTQPSTRHRHARTRRDFRPAGKLPQGTRRATAGR